MLCLSTEFLPCQMFWRVFIASFALSVKAVLKASHIEVRPWPVLLSMYLSFHTLATPFIHQRESIVGFLQIGVKGVRKDGESSFAFFKERIYIFWFARKFCLIGGFEIFFAVVGDL